LPLKSKNLTETIQNPDFFHFLNTHFLGVAVLQIIIAKKVKKISHTSIFRDASKDQPMIYMQNLKASQFTRKKSH